MFSKDIVRSWMCSLRGASIVAYENFPTLPKTTSTYIYPFKDRHMYNIRIKIPNGHEDLYGVRYVDGKLHHNRKPLNLMYKDWVVMEDLGEMV